MTEETKQERQKRWSRESYERNRAKVLQRSKVQYEENKELRKAQSAAVHLKNREDRNAKNLDRYYANREQRMEQRREYVAANRELLRARAREYAKNNPDVVSANTRKRTANKLKATPAWAVDFFMKEAFSLARLREKVCGGKWHVDHIVPLRSSLVCGLHCEHNLQVVPASYNLKKGNRHWPEGPWT